MEQVGDEIASLLGPPPGRGLAAPSSDPRVRRRGGLARGGLQELRGAAWAQLADGRHARSGAREGPGGARPRGIAALRGTSPGGAELLGGPGPDRGRHAGERGGAGPGGPGMPASQVERLVAGWRSADRSEARERDRARHEERALRVVPQADAASWSIRGRLEPEVGAVLRAALAAAAALYAAEAADTEASADVRRADALGLVAESALGGGLGALPAKGADPESAVPTPRPVIGRADRYQGVVHVSAETLEEEGESGEARIEGGPRVSARRPGAWPVTPGERDDARAGLRRLLDVGRRTRTVPAALRRALDHRDDGCRFPGCSSRHCDAHHLRHAGPTAARLGWTTSSWVPPPLPPGARGRMAGGANGGRRGPLPPSGRPAPSRGPGAGSRRGGPGRRPAAGRAGARHRGLRTPTPRWAGDRLDVDWALFTFAGPCARTSPRRRLRPTGSRRAGRGPAGRSRPNGGGRAGAPRPDECRSPPRAADRTTGGAPRPFFRL